MLSTGLFQKIGENYHLDFLVIDMVYQKDINFRKKYKRILLKDKDCCGYRPYLVLKIPLNW